jgi:hypothetical protein
MRGAGPDFLAILKTERGHCMLFSAKMRFTSFDESFVSVPV